MRRVWLTLAALLLAAPTWGQDFAEQKAAVERLMRANQVEQAEPQLERMAREHPNDPGVMAQLGLALYSLAAKAKEPARRDELAVPWPSR